jgi:hypothetical protein
MSLAARLGSLMALVLSLGSIGCATQNKVLTGPGYQLTHPDYWKVKQVASKEGEPSIVNIGQYSTTVVSEGVGATPDSMYESSQAEVEVRIYSWKDAEKAEDPTKKVAQKLIGDGDLQLAAHGQIPDQPPECGTDFKRKYNILKTDSTPIDLLKRPGFRTIVVGTQQQDMLLGVVSRVPYEQDGGLYCHNLSNMRTQLQNLLDALTLAPTAAGPAPAAASAPPTPTASTEAPPPSQ